MEGIVGEVITWFSESARWSGPNSIPLRALEHLQLAVVPTLIAALIGLPPAVWMAHHRRGEVLANAIVNVGRAVPSFGILVVAALFAIRWGVSLEFWPVVVALVALALPPIFTNAYTAVAGVDPAAVEASRGVGMTESQVITRVEVPMGSPVVLAGLRIAFVQVLATVPLAAVVSSSGGFGRYIVDGFALGSSGYDQVVAGALLVAGLTILAEIALEGVERLVVPTAIAGGRRADGAASFVAS